MEIKRLERVIKVLVSEIGKLIIQTKSLQEQINLQSEQIRLLNKRDDLALKIINLDKEELHS